MLVLLVACSWGFYCSSEVINGSTNNATDNGYTWNMLNVLPPESGLTVEGVFHKYTLSKDNDTDATVSITNKRVDGNGYIYEYTDNWNKLGGNTKIKYDPIPSTLGTLFGDGEIKVEGDGELSDVVVHYQFKYDTCHMPLKDPDCPEYEEALYKYLLDNDLINNEPEIDDPYYDEWVQFQLDLKAEEQEEQEKNSNEEENEEELEEELSIEDVLSITTTAEQIANPSQQLEMMEKLVASGKLDVYLAKEIDGGTYEETIKLDGGKITDNRRVLRSLQQDKLHNQIVRSQYKNME